VHGDRRRLGAIPSASIKLTLRDTTARDEFEHELHERQTASKPFDGAERPPVYEVAVEHEAG
jgi:hypothetical protein